MNALGAICLLLLSVSVLADEAAQAVADRRLTEDGRRIYLDGFLPDGSPLRAVRPEGLVLQGKDAACATCHRRSGMGSFESTVFVPPIAGSLLFRETRFDESYRNPSRFEGSFLDSRYYFRPDAWVRALTRPAYDAQTLARALRAGVDPAGKALVAPMPRFQLDDTAMAALTAYLRQLSVTSPPGIDGDELQLATVIAPDAPPGRAEAVLGVLKAWVASSGEMGEHWRLHEWHLTGEPATWAAQLDEYYRKQPVFAVLSGAGGDNWRPVHEFCETHEVPCVLPSLDVAPVDQGGFYSVYFSPGVTLEAEILQRYLLDAQRSRFERVIQVYNDDAGRQAATVLSRLSAQGVNVIGRRQRLTAPLAVFNDVGEDDALVLWLRPDAIAALAESMPDGPGAGRIFLSALLAPPESLALPPAWKKRVGYVSLFDDLDVQTEIARLRLADWLEKAGLPAHGEAMRPEADAFAACYITYRALREIRAEEVWRPSVSLGREHLLEELEGVISKNSDGTGLVDPHSHVAFYGRMSLGADQRVAVRGGSVLRYIDPAGSRLVAESPRIVP